MALMATRDAQKEKAPRTGCSKGLETKCGIPIPLQVRRFALLCKPRTAPDKAHAYKSLGTVTHRTSGPHKDVTD